LLQVIISHGSLGDNILCRDKYTGKLEPISAKVSPVTPVTPVDSKCSFLKQKNKINKLCFILLAYDLNYYYSLK